MVGPNSEKSGCLPRRPPAACTGRRDGAARLTGAAFTGRSTVKRAPERQTMPRRCLDTPCREIAPQNRVSRPARHRNAHRLASPAPRGRRRRTGGRRQSLERTVGRPRTPPAGDRPANLDFLCAGARERPVPPSTPDTRHPTPVRPPATSGHPPTGVQARCRRPFGGGQARRPPQAARAPPDRPDRSDRPDPSPPACAPLPASAGMARSLDEARTGRAVHPPATAGRAGPARKGEPRTLAGRPHARKTRQRRLR